MTAELFGLRKANANPSSFHIIMKVVFRFFLRWQKYLRLVFYLTRSIWAPSLTMPLNKPRSLFVKYVQHLVLVIHTYSLMNLSIATQVWEASWKVCHYRHLPRWLQDNNFLHRNHRPPLPSFRVCFKSVFRIHTETGNIWTHLLGCVAFIGVACYFLSRPSIEIQLQEKIVFGAFFLGAIICLGFSFAFHTLCCHSETVGKLFSKWVSALSSYIISFLCTINVSDWTTVV